MYYNNNVYQSDRQSLRFRRKQDVIINSSRRRRRHDYFVLTAGGIFSFDVFHDYETSEKEQQRVKSMLAAMEVGDSVVTTSGFYGILIDITEEDVIVEFGNNRNCRIPMRKSAIAEVEKASDGVAE